LFSALLILLTLLFLSACSDSGTHHPATQSSSDSEGTSGASLIVYVAHDREFSQAVLERFTRDTGIAVRAKYDDELTKSLGLVKTIIEERNHPRCDVFWNNELLGTLDLQDAGVLEPYKGSGWKRIPEKYKDDEGYWAGFAGRLRVWIFNTQPPPEILDEWDVDWSWQGEDLSKTTIANPLFGTTRTHFTVLWKCYGGEVTRSAYQDWRKRGLVMARSNGQTRNLVAEGTCRSGWTDTDDYFGAADAGKPVTWQLFEIDIDPMRLTDHEVWTICIPNTVAIIKGTKNKAAAQKLVDYLLSAENEIRLATSAARQIPLGPVDETQVPAEVRELMPHAARGYPLKELGDARRECLAWIKAEVKP
jgi:iron(III) transport system substrate-binding protein